MADKLVYNFGDGSAEGKAGMKKPFLVARVRTGGNVFVGLPVPPLYDYDGSVRLITPR